MVESERRANSQKLKAQKGNKMSLDWYWKEKIGEIDFCRIYDKEGEKEYTDKWTYSLYQGNAYIIALCETEKEYNLQWFFSNKEHMKRCLEDGIFNNELWFEMRINEKALLKGKRGLIDFIDWIRRSKTECEIILADECFLKNKINFHKEIKDE